MKVETYLYRHGWNKPLNRALDSEQTLVILFCAQNTTQAEGVLADVIAAFPSAVVIGASAAGEIYQDTFTAEGVVAAVACFARTRLKLVSQSISSPEYSYENGKFIAGMLDDPSLKGMFVLSDGLNVNGSKLTKGINAVLERDVVVTGGLAGDDDRFTSTWVVVDGKLSANYITAVGFYGDHIHLGYGSKGGWDRMGISRRVTRSDGNVLYELDGQPALEIYKRYLGERAAGLPGTGLLFPLELEERDAGGEKKVRTILAIEEAAGSITFAGDLPEGSLVSLMKANFNRLIDGAARAAESVDLAAYHSGPILSIAISCVGRHLVLKQRTEDELEAVMESLPPVTRQIGFYSYGEISPLHSGSCDLHNQTMTLTLLWESHA